MTYAPLESIWRGRACHHCLLLQDLCGQLSVLKFDPITNDSTQDAYIFERGVNFGDDLSKRSTDRIRTLSR